MFHGTQGVLILRTNRNKIFRHVLQSHTYLVRLWSRGPLTWQPKQRRDFTTLNSLRFTRDRKPCNAASQMHMQIIKHLIVVQESSSRGLKRGLLVTSNILKRLRLATKRAAWFRGNTHRCQALQVIAGGAIFRLLVHQSANGDIKKANMLSD
jgi:hypothetical protein